MPERNFENPDIDAIASLDRYSKPALVGITFALMAAVAAVDYATGYEISCTVFYLISVGIATWFVSAWFGVLVSVLSAALTSLINIFSGAHFHNRFAPYWNATIVLTFYLIVVWLLRSLRLIQDTLEQRVRERTAKLSAELAERKRLESEVLEISEREQRRIGIDIHDSLCQHLTGTALAEQFLLEKLSSRDAPEVRDADRVVGLIEEAITLARGVAASLFPNDIAGDGLPVALRDLASYFSSQFKVACRSTCEGAITIRDPAVAMHLYRIAQEAVHNAIRHGKAANIRIHLNFKAAPPVLAVTDDGTGLPAGVPTRAGMGLRNMKYRASIIGGDIALTSADKGALLTCWFCPEPPST